MDVRFSRVVNRARTMSINIEKWLFFSLWKFPSERIKVLVYGFVLECMATGFARPPFDSMSLLSMQSSWLNSQYKIIYRWCNCLFNQVVFIYFLYDSDEQLIAREPHPAREIFYFNSRCSNLIDGKNKKYWVIKRVVPHYFDI